MLFILLFSSFTFSAQSCLYLFTHSHTHIHTQNHKVVNHTFSIIPNNIITSPPFIKLSNCFMQMLNILRDNVTNTQICDSKNLIEPQPTS